MSRSWGQESSMNRQFYLSMYFHNYTQTWSLTFPVLANIQNIFNKWPDVLPKFLNEVDPINYFFKVQLF